MRIRIQNQEMEKVLQQQADANAEARMDVPGAAESVCLASRLLRMELVKQLLLDQIYDEQAIGLSKALLREAVEVTTGTCYERNIAQRLKEVCDVLTSEDPLTGADDGRDSPSTGHVGRNRRLCKCL